MALSVLIMLRAAQHALDQPIPKRRGKRTFHLVPIHEKGRSGLDAQLDSFLDAFRDELVHGWALYALVELASVDAYFLSHQSRSARKDIGLVFEQSFVNGLEFALLKRAKRCARGFAGGEVHGPRYETIARSIPRK